jgi:hypothetical protein
VAEALAQTKVDMVFSSTTRDFRDLIGRSLTVHDGPSKTDPTIARAVCGSTADGNLYSLGDNDGSTASVGLASVAGVLAFVATGRLML